MYCTICAKVFGTPGPFLKLLVSSIGGTTSVVGTMVNCNVICAKIFRVKILEKHLNLKIKIQIYSSHVASTRCHIPTKYNFIWLLGPLWRKINNNYSFETFTLLWKLFLNAEPHLTFSLMVPVVAFGFTPDAFNLDKWNRCRELSPKTVYSFPDYILIISSSNSSLVSGTRLAGNVRHRQLSVTQSVEYSINNDGLKISRTYFIFSLPLGFVLVILL